MNNVSYLQGTECEGALLVDCIHVVRNRYKRRVRVNLVMNCRVPEKTTYFYEFPECKDDVSLSHLIIIDGIDIR